MRHFTKVAAVLTAIAATIAADAPAADAPALYPIARGSATSGTQKFGYIDSTGRTVIPVQYDWAGKFYDDRAQVRIGGKVGYINRRGKLIVPAVNEFGRNYSEGLVVVKNKDQQWSVLDRDGRVVVAPKYGSIGRISDGMIVVGSAREAGRPTRYGAVDTNGHLVIDMEYEGIGTFSNGRAPVKINDKYGYISKTGELVIPAIYDYANSFVDGRANVGVDVFNDRRKQAIIDTSGTYVIPPKHDYVIEFKNGTSIAIDTDRGETLHLFDLTGRKLAGGIDPKTLCDRNPYEPWHADNLTVLKSVNGKCYYADVNGQNRFKRNFERAWPFVGGLAIVWVSAQEAFSSPNASKRLFAGVIDETGAFLVPPVFDRAWIDSPDVIRVQWKDKQDEYLDRKGRPLTFSDVELKSYIEEMRIYFGPLDRDASRTVVAKAADGDYYLSLPKGFCVFDMKNVADAHLLDEMKDKAAPIEAGRSAATARSLTSGDRQRSRQAIEPTAAFALCDDLHDPGGSDSRQKLTRFGVATGLRRERKDPSANAGNVFISRFICGGLRGGGAAGLRQQTKQQASVRISEAWMQVTTGTPAQLGAVSEQLFGCSSVGLIPEAHGAIAATIMTLALLPDWSVIMTRTAKPKSETELLQLLDQEEATINTITKHAMEVMAAEER